MKRVKDTKRKFVLMRKVQKLHEVSVRNDFSFYVRLLYLSEVTEKF